MSLHSCTYNLTFLAIIFCYLTFSGCWLPPGNKFVRCSWWVLKCGLDLYSTLNISGVMSNTWGQMYKCTYNVCVCTQTYIHIKTMLIPFTTHKSLLLEVEHAVRMCAPHKCKPCKCKHMVFHSQPNNTKSYVLTRLDTHLCMRPQILLSWKVFYPNPSLLCVESSTNPST